ncbi:hypothetical protein [Ruficoccus sp. ZRK36]|uniref:chorismate transformation enzyme, FkbO/Hyg5 family n=1 Tax=Ruficoccus sp. ZRK36 TaxID=2866311 RepID=UPI001C73CB89|nr:hypothetical protein [Ruficoccus sp. ZRK36]QYY36233.1 hypothetical protein K0V07_01920 [Ruficoccus sp. ZRK36]
MSVSVRFGASRSAYSPQQSVLDLALPLLAGSGQEFLWSGELTSADDLLWQGRQGPWRCIALSMPTGDDLAEATRLAFGRLLGELGTDHCLRIWNFVPWINEHRDGLENYRAFCLGRHEAFSAHFKGVPERHFCAASAVGIEEPRLTVVALASERSVVQLENPFQCPAYEYPEEYGPRPPSFSRASLVAGGEPVVYVSGTSAVLGSASVAPGMLEAQLKTTGENLDRMQKQTEHALGADTFRALGKPIGRVYLRRAEDTLTALAWLEEQPWYAAELTSVVQADICRQELMVEVELSWPGGLMNTLNSRSTLAERDGCDHADTYGCERV